MTLPGTEPTGPEAPLELPPLTPPVKRSVSIDGHATSVTLEDAFWRGLRDAARARATTPARLIARIDHARPPDVGLATAIRLFVLAQAQLAPRPAAD